jgi:hypothetical protein
VGVVELWELNYHCNQMKRGGLVRPNLYLLHIASKDIESM